MDAASLVKLPGCGGFAEDSSFPTARSTIRSRQELSAAAQSKNNGAAFVLRDQARGS